MLLRESRAGHWYGLFVALRQDLTAGDPREVQEAALAFLRASPGLVAELQRASRPEALAEPVMDPHDAYAFGRIVDILLGPHQTPAPLGADREWWDGPLPGVDLLPTFMAQLGATQVPTRTYHPFFHEVVSVELAEDPAAPITVEEEVWPAFMMDALLLARAGVRVRGGAHHIGPQAATSPLFWAWWRRNRRPMDLSHGWGHNSQWRTNGRRDFLIDGVLHYNAGATPDEDEELRGDWPADVDWSSLVRHRHAMTETPDADAWPYDTTVVEPLRPNPG